MCVTVSLFSRVWFFATLWTVAHQAPLSMGFSRQECWSGLPFPTPGDLSGPGLKLMCLLHWQVDPLQLHHLGSPYFSLSPDCLLFFEKEHKAIMCHGLRTTRKERICTHQLEKPHKRHPCVSLGEVLLQVELVVKNPSTNVGDGRDAGSIPGSGRSPGGGHGNPHQYACLGNPMDRGALWATVHGVTNSWYE